MTLEHMMVADDSGSCERWRPIIIFWSGYKQQPKNAINAPVKIIRVVKNV